jgi:hypothetical protein
MVTAAVLGLLLGAQAPPPVPPQPPRPAPARAGLSWQDADSLDLKIQTFEKRPRGAPPSGTVLVTEGELNSYLNLTLAGKMPAGLRDLDIRLDKDRLLAAGDVDFDQMRKKMPPTGPLNPIAFLGGRIPFDLRGRLITSQDGFGNLEFEHARLGPVSLPVSFLAQCVASFSKTQENPQGFDILSPFRLPYALKRVRVQPWRLVLDF